MIACFLVAYQVSLSLASAWGRALSETKEAFSLGFKRLQEGVSTFYGWRLELLVGLFGFWFSFRVQVCTDCLARKLN
jgi:hypothetical protein